MSNEIDNINDNIQLTFGQDVVDNIDLNLLQIFKNCVNKKIDILKETLVKHNININIINLIIDDYNSFNFKRKVLLDKDLIKL